MHSRPGSGNCKTRERRLQQSESLPSDLPTQLLRKIVGTNNCRWYKCSARSKWWAMLEMSCVKMCMFYMCYIIFSYYLTVAAFPATYTLQKLGRSLQKNEKLFNVCLAQSNFAPIHLSRRNTPPSEKYTSIWNTSFVCRHF
jgi:hypothetical protein